MNAILSMTLGAIAALTVTTAMPMGDTPKKDAPVELGNFSVSLTVKDIQASIAFYEKLDFVQVGGDVKQKWVVLKNGTTKIGLFQGMFPRNMLTFNPGWNSDKETLKEFQDVRDIQRTLAARGIEFKTKADENSDGPASFVLEDPDGNPVLFDQHVPRPKAGAKDGAPKDGGKKGAEEGGATEKGTDAKKAPHVTGIGGVFFKSTADHKALSAWYEKHLGIPMESWGGAVLRWPDDHANDGGLTVWNAAPRDTKWFQPGDASFMINYRVDDLAGMLASLRAAGVTIVKGPETAENGTFAWILDLEGNKVELWEPKLWEETSDR